MLLTDSGERRESQRCALTKALVGDTLHKLIEEDDLGHRHRGLLRAVAAHKGACARGWQRPHRGLHRDKQDLRLSKERAQAATSSLSLQRLCA